LLHAPAFAQRQYLMKHSFGNHENQPIVCPIPAFLPITYNGEPSQFTDVAVSGLMNHSANSASIAQSIFSACSRQTRPAT
jgi:hypothetical protein